MVVQHPRPSGLKFKPFDLAQRTWLQRQLDFSDSAAARRAAPA